MNLLTEFLAYAAKLLLEYNDSTREIHRSIESTCRSQTDQKCSLVVAYGRITVSVGDGKPLLMRVQELRYNAALQAHVHAILEQVQRREIELPAAIEQLKTLEARTFRYPRGLAAILLGVAASALASLLGADAGALVAVGVATALGLVARQELGRRHFNLLMLPWTAAFIGAFLGGFAVRLGWTQSVGLALIVPSLMLVPGPHLINGLLDLVDNHVSIALARLGLATAILVACALGIVAGMELTLPNLPLSDQTVSSDHLNFFTDIFLAGIVTVGFAVFYNTAWPHVGPAALGGMIGHGSRYLLLQAGARLEVATFFGALAVGIVAAYVARSYRLPVAVVSFAGAVTMMPGVQMYQALGGARQLARLGENADFAELAKTVGDALQSGLIVGALALGLIVAARTVPLVPGGKMAA